MSDEKNLGDPKVIGKAVAESIAVECESVICLVEPPCGPADKKIKSALDRAAFAIRSLLAEIEKNEKHVTALSKAIRFNAEQVYAESMSFVDRMSLEEIERIQDHVKEWRKVLEYVKP